MAPTTRDNTDPNTLISTILTHLPSFRNKPDIATAAFETIRRASQTSSVQRIGAALLAPLTALSLNSTSATVRSRAGRTCILLLRCLVLRRLRNWAAAYVEDVVKLAYNIVAHENNDHVLCILPSFTKATVEDAASFENRPKIVEDVLHLPISSVTLEALLHLLALLIPSCLSMKQPENDEDSKGESNLVFFVEAVTADGIKLWNCIGSRAQAKVLNLASSKAFLSAQCGYEVANAAVHIWERAFDPAACYVVPPSLQENLRLAVNEALRESYVPQKDVRAAQPVRAGLYRLCQLSDPHGKIDGVTWSECGIREAALPETDLSMQLRSFSKSGLVHSYVLQTASVKKEECAEPPTKKRKIGNTDSSSVALERTMESGERTQNTASDYQRMTVHGLFKSVKALPSTDVCATHPQSMLMLAHACCLAADSIRNIFIEGEDRIDSIREWLSFASSLSQIGQDLIGNATVEFENRPLGALAILARGCLRLGLVLTELKSHLARNRTPGRVNGTEFVDTTIIALLSVVVNAYTHGSACTDESENPYPASQFAELVADITNAIREKQIQCNTIGALKTCCERFMQGVFNGNLTLEAKCIVLPRVLELSRYQKVFHPGVPIESSIGDICSYISNFDSTQVFPRGCLKLLGHAICFKIHCEHNHELKQYLEEGFSKETPRLDERNWKNVYTSLRKMRDILRDDIDILDLVNCAGLLSIHSPQAREKETLEFFVSLMQNGSIGVLPYKIKLLPVLLVRSEREFLQSTVRDVIDMEDPDGLQTPGSARKEKVDHYEQFGLKMNDCARQFMSVAIEGTEDETNFTHPTLFGSVLWSCHYISTPKMFALIGLVITGLLARTIKELTPLSSNESVRTNVQKIREHFLDENVPCTLSAWNHILMTASIISNEFSPQISGRSTTLGLDDRLSDQEQDLNERRSLSLLVGDLLNSRLREVLPHCIKQLLGKPSFSRTMEELVSEGNKNSFWVRVPRHTVIELLKKDDRSTLEELAERVERPVETLVERASADALAMAFMTDTSGLSLKTDGSNGLILKVLSLSLDEVVRKKFGKIVQRLVMEFGGPKESAAKRGLVALSTFMPNRRNMDLSMEQIAGVLISSNFMLVMDAVNRGFFNSKTTMQERRRHLQMLEVVLALCSDQLHLFVPKVMATLKMALDVTKRDNALYRQTLELWRSFLRLLGSKRLVPHLGTVFAILIPVRYDQGNILLNELKRVINCVSPAHVRDKPSLLLLLRIMKQAVFHDAKHLNQGYERICSDKSLSIEELHEVCKNIESIMGHHENESIETYASQYLFSVLRNHRHVLNAVLPSAAEQAQNKQKKELDLLTDMLETLVSQLNKTKSVYCQDVLVRCIGEIGAIDPGLLPQNHKTRSSSLCVGGVAKQSYPKSVHGFASVLLNGFLVTALRKGEKQEASKSQFNRVGLVIQELLRVCGCKKSTPVKSNIPRKGKSQSQLGEEWESILVRLPADGKATMFWESLSSTTRDAVQPYLAVPFDVNQYCMIFGENAERSVSPACQPVWSKVRALVPLGRSVTAQEWIRQISVQLVDFVGRQGQFGELLKALRPVLRYEDQVNNYIFPLVVATALDLQQSLNLKEVKEFLIREIKEVLMEATSPQAVFDLLDILRTWRDKRCERKGAQSYSASYAKSMGSHGGQTSSRKRIPAEKFMDMSVVNDPLTSLVDLYGRESDDLSLLIQARAALASRSYYRAILLAEYHIRNTRINTGWPGWPSYIGIIRGRARKSDIYNSNSETKALEVLQEAFANIEDVPNMEGIAKLRLESTLTEVICDSEAAGKYDEALAMYEHALADEPRSAALHNGFLSCLMTLGHWETMLSHAEGLVFSSTLRETEMRQTAKAHGIAAAWRLGRWDKLEDLRNVTVETSPFHANEEQAEAPWLLEYTTKFANMLLCVRNGELEPLEKESSLARRHLIRPLLRAARESYHRAYPIITLVHSLCEAEDAARHHLLSSREKSCAEGQAPNRQTTYLNRLASEKKRIQCTSRSLKVREPLLSSRRVLFGLVGSPDEAAEAHLELAKLAKEGDNLKAASASALRALLTKNINSDVINAANIESAHIRRAYGDVSEAVLTAKREIDRLRRNLNRCISQGLPAEQKEVIHGQLCTALVLAGTWSEETGYETSERILRYYQEATKFGADREEPFYALGKHFDSLLQAGANADSTIAVTTDLDGKTRQQSDDESSSSENHQQYVPGVIRSFAKALSNGHKRIFEALPRMLTVWFDFHTALHDDHTARLCVPYEQSVQAEMQLAMKSIPSYMWVTAIPQLMSRILHPRMEVRDDLRDVLATAVVNFPDQSMWMILPSSQLRNAERKKATADIMGTAVTLLKKTKTREAREYARSFKIRASIALNVFRILVGICITQLPKELRGKKEKCTKEFSGLKKTFRCTDNPSLIIPTLRSLTVQLPDEGGSGEHRPFAAEPVRIADVEDEVLVMSSLMRPRRISLIGSDGLQYRYLAKRENQGDMRKDSRMVEFLTVVNRLLAREEGSRGKTLGLKTYAVLPLSEETGLIEWVNDLEALRNVVRSEHNWLGQLPDAMHIFRQYENAATKRQFLEEWAFEKFPPVMDKYFVRKFGGGADARAWLHARNTWAQSCAVWSMAGYIVGLGDRHGENVLVDSTSGRCVHVDFAMLFDKGHTLKVPEIVPFRLTRNMVTVMGVAGYEGLYRAVAETVLGAMRRNWEAVLGVLESFLHDPLADWRGGAAEGGSKEGHEMRAAVKAKLRGVVDASGLALSIGGQVERLVGEATDVERLSRMYVWWAAWI